MRYFLSQWENALSDLKNAAHDAGVPPEFTDAWAVTRGKEGELSTFGAYDAAGEFHTIAKVAAPWDLRELSRLYPEPAPTVVGPVTRDADGESDDDTERAEWLPMGDAPDVRAFPV